MTPRPIPDCALNDDIAVLGKKGRGKTYCAKGIVERLLDLGHRVIVLDPLSTWWGLRLSSDGKREGYPIVVFGGPHADIEIDDKSGKALAGALLAEKINAVIDLGLMRKAEQARLVADLLDELFTHNRSPLTIVLEEADAFAPQQPMGDMIRVLSEVDRIARRGRAFGFRLISITQRPAKLNKDVLTQLSTLVALGVTSPQDRDAIKAWVEGNADRGQAKEVYDSLAGLPVGTGWVWAPDQGILDKIAFPRIKTLDTSATPKGGERRFEPHRLAPTDLDRLRGQMIAKSPDAAPAPKMGRQSTVLPAPADPNAIRAAEDRGRRAGFEDGKRVGYADGYRAAQREAQLAVAALKPDEGTLASLPAAPRPALNAPKTSQAPADDDATSIGPERRPLAALASAYPAGLTESQWATITGMKRGSGTWKTYRSRLKVAGLIEAKGDLWHATSSGVAAAGDVAASADTPEERIAMWKRAVGAAGRLLDALVEVYPAAMSKADLGAATGLEFTSGTFKTYLSKLVANDLATRTGDEIRASDDLFIKLDAA